MGPTQTIVPTASAQVQQSVQTQNGVQQTGADLLNTMTQQRLDKLYQTQDTLNKEIGNTIKASSTSVPVSGTSAVKPPQLHQWPIIPNDERPTYSRSATKEEGIANMVRGAANVVGSYIVNKKNEEQKSLAVDIERIMEAHQGIQTAKQALQENPNNADAKAAIQKNNDIINSLLSDPKKRNKIGKAFDINFVDPTQNNKPEHGAMKQALQSYSEQLEKKMPTTMAPNQIAQQKLGQLKDLSDTIDKQISALHADRMESIYAKSLADQEKLALDTQKEQDKVDHWNKQAQQRDQEFQQKLGQQAAIARLMVNTRFGVEAMRDNAALGRINRMISGRLQYADHLGLSGANSIKVLNGNIALAQKALQMLPTQILQAQTEFNRKDASPQDKQNFQNYINNAEQLQTMYRQMISDDQAKLSVMMQLGETDYGPGSNTGSTNVNKPSDNNTNKPKSEPPSRPESKSVSKQPIHITKQPDEDKSDEYYTNLITKSLAGS